MQASLRLALLDIRSLLVLIGSLCCSLSILDVYSAAEERPLIPRSAFFSKQTHTNVRLSPDGTKYTYIRIKGDELSAWVAPLDSPADVKRVGMDVPGKTHDCFWSADGTRLILWQEVEPGIAHLVRLDVESGVHLDLTPIPNSVCRFAGVSVAVPDEVLFTTNDRDPEVNELWRVHLDSGKRTLVQDTSGFTSMHVDRNFAPRIAEKLKGSKGSYQIELLALDVDAEERPFCTLSYDELGFYDNARPTIGLNTEGSRCFVVTVRSWTSVPFSR